MNRVHALLVVVPLILVSGGSAAQPFRSTPETSSAASFSGGDGSSIETAVVVLAKNEVAGVRAERQWLRDHFPGVSLGDQALLHKDGRQYDRFELVLANGEKKVFFFDITGYFGKF